MENQLRAGEESDDEGESRWNLWHCQMLTLFFCLWWWKTSYLEARICQMESSYLEVLRQLQDTKTLDAAQREAVQKLVGDALKREMKSVARQQVTRYCRATGQKKLVPQV